MIQLFNVIELLVATDEEMPSPLPLTTSHCWQGKSRIHPPCLSRTRPGGSSWPKTVVSPPAAAGLQCTAGGHRTIGDAHREPALPRRTMLLDDGPCPPVLGKGHSLLAETGGPVPWTCSFCRLDGMSWPTSLRR